MVCSECRRVCFFLKEGNLTIVRKWNIAYCGSVGVSSEVNQRREEDKGRCGTSYDRLISFREEGVDRRKQRNMLINSKTPHVVTARQDGEVR